MVLLIATRLLFILAFLCCSASEPESGGLAKLDVFLGYSYVHVSFTSTTGFGTQNLNGADIFDSYRLKPWLHMVADFGLAGAGYRASCIIGIRARGTQTAFLLGPRFVLPIGRTAPFVEVLFGVAHASTWLFDTSGKQTDFAWAFGGGFDYRLTTHLALRPLQLEFLRTNFFELQDGKLTQNDFRASTGIVFRF
jgi:hypothetical protein